MIVLVYLGAASRKARDTARLIHERRAVAIGRGGGAGGGEEVE